LRKKKKKRYRVAWVQKKQKRKVERIRTLRAQKTIVREEEKIKNVMNPHRIEKGPH